MITNFNLVFVNWFATNQFFSINPNLFPLSLVVISSQGFPYRHKNCCVQPCKYVNLFQTFLTPLSPKPSKRMVYLIHSSLKSNTNGDLFVVNFSNFFRQHVHFFFNASKSAFPRITKVFFKKYYWIWVKHSLENLWKMVHALKNFW